MLPPKIYRGYKCCKHAVNRLLIWWVINLRNNMAINCLL